MADRGAGLSPGMGRQLEIYKAGLGGKTPEQPVSIEELEREAASVLSQAAYDYVAGGAGSEDTMRANLEAFRRHRLVPRYLRDVSRRDLGVEILGSRLPTPILLAPIGVLSIVHKEAELAVARAAALAGRPDGPEHGVLDPDRAGRRGDGRCPAWFQLYWPRERRAGRQLRSAAPSARASPRSW